MISGLRSEATVLFLCSILFAAGYVCVCWKWRGREYVWHIYTEPAAPCLWLIMCLIICAISSEASRESFKLGLSVCLEYLLMMPPALGSCTASTVPVSTTLACETTYKHTHWCGHMLHLQYRRSTFNWGPLQKHCNFLLSYCNQCS